MKRILSFTLVILMLMTCTFPASAIGSDFSIDANTSKSQYIPGEQVLISGQVTKSGAGYSDTTVIIKIQNADTKTNKFVKEVLTDSEGEFSASYNLSKDVESGSYNVIINSVNITKVYNFTVLSAESTLELDKDSYYQGDEVNINGLAIKDGEEQSYVTVIIKVLYENQPKFTKELKTDNNGRYETSYKLKDDELLGIYTVRAEILGKTLEKLYTVKEEPIVLSEIEIEASETEMKVGEEIELSITGKMSDGSIAPESELEGVEWISSDEEKATVDNEGRVTGIKAGEVTITARVGELEDTVEITVKKKHSSSHGGSGNSGSSGGVSNGDSDEEEEQNQEQSNQEQEKFEDFNEGKFSVIEDEDGNVSTLFVVDNDKLNDQINNEENDNVKINANIKKNANQMIVSMNSELISKLNEKGKKLITNMGEVTIEIESNSFNVEQGTEISIKVSKIDDNEGQNLFSKVESNKYNSASKIFDLSLLSINNESENKLDFNKPITLKINYDQQKVTDNRKLGVYYYNELLDKWQYVGGKVDTEGTMVFTVNHFSKYTVMEYNKTFEDINIPWAKDEIEVLTSRHIIDGISDTNYAPNNNISRAAFAKLIVKALNLKSNDNKVMFTDVEEGRWYTEPVNIAANTGIVEGDNGKFNPSGDITREAMATMIVRGLKYVAPEDDYIETVTGFEDSEYVSDWAKHAVSIAYSKGIVEGMSETIFAPKANATRAQAAVMIYRMLEALDLL